MPFTVSHAAAALPLYYWNKSRLPLAALVIGSMSPDAAYFVPFGLRSESHSLTGILYFCWPVGLALWIVFEYLLKKPTLSLMPDVLRARIPERRIKMRVSLLLKASFAIALGALTHIVWDTFTHGTSPLVTSFPILQATVADLGGQSYPLYRVLQHFSTLFGLGVLVSCVIIWWRKSGADERQLQSNDHLPIAWRISAIAAILIASLVGAVVDYTLHSLGSLERQLFFICIGGMTGFVLGWCAVSVLIRWKWRERL